VNMLRGRNRILADRLRVRLPLAGDVSASETP